MIGEDVSERLDVIPAQFRALVTRRPNYACRRSSQSVAQACCARDYPRSCSSPGLSFRTWSPTEDTRYTLAQWSGLIRFLDDGMLGLNTNQVENQIRPIALTRKYALFADNEIGAENWIMLAARRHLQDVRREPG